MSLAGPLCYLLDVRPISSDCNRMSLAADVLAFWFDPAHTADAEARQRRWFEVDPRLDAEIGKRFRGAVEDAAAGRLDDLAATYDGSLALVILLDQFSRNVYRGTPQAYANDPKARAVAAAVLDHGQDREHPPLRRQFFYLPFMHSEDLADQERSVARYRELGLAEQLDFAIRHRDIVARFGR